jgi:hypothetical protein
MLPYSLKTVKRPGDYIIDSRTNNVHFSSFPNVLIGNPDFMFFHLDSPIKSGDKRPWQSIMAFSLMVSFPARTYEVFYPDSTGWIHRDCSNSCHILQHPLHGMHRDRQYPYPY